MINSHNGKTFKGQRASFTQQVSVWAVRGSSKGRFSPSRELVISSAHLESRTALTDEGLLLGTMAFESVMSHPARWLTSGHG
jgi:hypothetical protein